MASEFSLSVSLPPAENVRSVMKRRIRQQQAQTVEEWTQIPVKNNQCPQLEALKVSLKEADGKHASGAAECCCFRFYIRFCFIKKLVREDAENHFFVK